MTFRRGGAGKRRDANEGAITEALRQVGCEIFYISGRGLPDVLVRVPRGYNGQQWVPLEIKGAKGRMTKRQADIRWRVVRTVSEALEAIGVAPEAIR